MQQMLQVRILRLPPDTLNLPCSSKSNQDVAQLAEAEGSNLMFSSQQEVVPKDVVSKPATGHRHSTSGKVCRLEPTAVLDDQRSKLLHNNPLCAAAAIIRIVCWHCLQTAQGKTMTRWFADVDHSCHVLQKG